MSRRPDPQDVDGDLAEQEDIAAYWARHSHDYSVKCEAGCPGHVEPDPVMDRAVEAGARAVYQDSHPARRVVPWTELDDAIRDSYRHSVRCALDAAVLLLTKPARAHELRDFGEFILHPRETGLDQYTLNQVWLEANHRADGIERTIRG